MTPTQRIARRLEAGDDNRWDAWLEERDRQLDLAEEIARDEYEEARAE